MSMAPGHTTWGMPVAAAASNRCAPAHHTSGELVSKFRGRYIQNAGKVCVGDQALHRLSARTGCMENQGFEASLLQDLPGSRDARRGYAEHSSGNKRLGFLRHSGLLIDHARDS